MQLIALARTIVDASVRMMNAGYDLFKATVDVTVQVIRGLIDLGVRIVRGLARATVAVITGLVEAIGAVIDRITDRFGPDDGTTPENETLRVLRTDTQLSDEPSADIASFALTTGDLAETDGSEPRTESTDEEDETQGLERPVDRRPQNATETTGARSRRRIPLAPRTRRDDADGEDTKGSKDETTGSEEDDELAGIE